MTARPPAPDQAQRDAAVRARGVNVVVDAGAGTGKTTLLVARLLEMVAPADDSLPQVSLHRIAAITFTRKAAGELKLRIRESLLSALSATGLSRVRRDRLASALDALDTAHVGTIHGFADRLLRMRPVEARLGPSYEVVDDASALVAETFSVLREAVEAGTLATELAGLVDPARAAEAQAALLDAMRVGVRVHTRSYEHFERCGLDRLVERLVLTRDVDATAPEPTPPDLGAFRDRVADLGELVANVRGPGLGSRFLREAGERLERLRAEEDPVRVFAELRRVLRQAPQRARKGVEFDDDEAAWGAWKAWTGKDPDRPTALRDDLVGPFARWMARRLVRAAPAVVRTYEKVKARHRAVDQVDLLLCLRDLLQRRKDVRAEYQRMFDHVFVDEFQDTDPLQAEVVLYLCEEGARAESWREVTLAPGKLTVVGDPKQSIYRFRRADVSVYAEVRAIVERGDHLVSRLTASFRSEPALVAWLNRRFDDVLGVVPEGARTFDRERGTVANEALLPGREGDARRRAVVVLPLASEDTTKGAYRETEARAIAAWLRRTVEGRERTVVDPVTRATRPVRWGDVAVLAFSTQQVPLLFPQLDRLGVPYTARGGTLFLQDPLHRQFLLALRAIADRDDGVAQAALLRAPFFAVDYEDLARERAAEEGSTHEGVRRARESLAVVRDLRRRRLERSPGETARDLLERTAFGRTVALGANGAQRLDSLRELCLALDAVAAEEGLDFDGATSRLREWATDPVQLDPPRPVEADAVQILTVHQAKGLEFPVVVLWDACADLAAREERPVFAVARDGASWILEVDGLRWEEPADGSFAARERSFLDAERRRLAYVAATRARDLLVLPVAGAPQDQRITGRLVGPAPETPDPLVETLETFSRAEEPAWASGAAPPSPRPRGDAAALAERVAAAWSAASTEAARPRFAPIAVTAEAQGTRGAPPPGDLLDEGPPRPPRQSRYGRVFGDAVHRAIGLALRDASLAPAAAAERAAREVGLAERRTEAAEDVARALAALSRAGLRRAPGADLRLEYPIAVARDGLLVEGYVDLLAVHEGRVVVVDFKTDAPPAGELAASHAAYVEQVRSYAAMLEQLGIAEPGTVRTALLFTADGLLRWVERA